MTGREGLWRKLRGFAENRHPRPIETTLLGDVPYTVSGDGTLTSLIPDYLAEEARKHWLAIIAADYTRNVYVIRSRLESTRKKENDGRNHV